MFINKNNWWKHAVFSLYVILLAIVVFRHESWFDEAQAWLLARDSSLFELMVKYLRYEGSPGLWHLLLFVPAKLHLPYFSMNLLAAAIAAAGVYVFLRYSPFPLFIKVLFPFTFFVFYQYAAVARSYALLPVLLFSIAAVYKNKVEKPYLFALLLILLANVSLHGLIIASGIAFMHVVDLVKNRLLTNKAYIFRNLAALVIFCAVLFLIIIQLKRPPDLISVAGFNLDMSRFFPRSMLILTDSLSTNLSIAAGGYPTLYGVLGLLAKITIVVSLFWFILRKRLLEFLIPFVGLGLLFTVVYAQVWHQGILFLVWVFVLWLSFESPAGCGNKLDKTSRALILTCMAAVLCVQVFWSFNSFKYDLKYDYSASRAAAGYIKHNYLQDKKIYVTNFHSISILPYFEDNIFCNYNNNQKPSFWLWSPKNSMYREPYLAIGDYNPDFIILGIKNYSPGRKYPDEPVLQPITGYRFVKHFSGGLYWKDKLLETDSFELYEKIVRP